jgi:hypothetical protein
LGSANVLNPLNKINQVVALAGLVLRLFRSKQPNPTAHKAPVRILYGSRKAAVRQPLGSPVGQKGGLRHG